jgi:hypothetical protein
MTGSASARSVLQGVCGGNSSLAPSWISEADIQPARSALALKADISMAGSYVRQGPAADIAQSRPLIQFTLWTVGGRQRPSTVALLGP